MCHNGCSVKGPWRLAESSQAGQPQTHCSMGCAAMSVLATSCMICRHAHSNGNNFTPAARGGVCDGKCRRAPSSCMCCSGHLAQSPLPRRTAASAAAAAHLAPERLKVVPLLRHPLRKGGERPLAARPRLSSVPAGCSVAHRAYARPTCERQARQATFGCALLHTILASSGSHWLNWKAALCLLTA